jgi:L-2-hydroxyglutarate oxidase LhgO
VGAGILGLATARELLVRHPGLDLVVLEKESAVGVHQTSHSSGVIHAGVYYAPGSLKARLCVEGSRLLYDYCEERAIPFARCGKLIVASSRADLTRLDGLQERARANGVKVRRLAAAEIQDIEPFARGAGAIHSPDTGIVDYSRVAEALREDVVRAGGRLHTRCEVHRVEDEELSDATIVHALGRTRARLVVTCAGLWSDRLATASGVQADLRIVPFRGAYFRLRRPELCRSLIYPVPDPGLPFLGVHLTKRIDGDVVVGPSALLVGARDAYRLRAIRSRDVVDTLTWPGTYRLVRRWWRHGLTEVLHASSRRAYARAAQALVPALRSDDLERAFAGIRAQAVDRQGRLVDDFVLTQSRGALHVRNAPSPAATSSLAIARQLVDRVT